jgi:hypothetical protein
LQAQAHDRDGAIPPTGGVPPEDAPAARGHAASGHAPAERADDLVAVIDLLVRAARKGLGGVDQRLEAATERALLRLQQLDTARLEALDDAAGTEGANVEQLAADVGRELADVIERIAERVEAALPAQAAG